MLYKQRILLLVSLFFLLSCKAQASENIEEISTAEQIWSINLGRDEIITQPVSDDEYLYIHTNNGVYVYRNTLGNLIWKSEFPTEEIIQRLPNRMALTIGEHLIAAQTAANTIIIYNRTDGEIKWSTESENINPQLDGNVEDVVITGDILFVAKYNDVLSAYNSETGKILWRKPVPQRRTLRALPFENLILLARQDAIGIYNIQDPTLYVEFENEGYAQNFGIDSDYLYITYDSGKCSASALNLVEMKYTWCLPSLAENKIREGKIGFDSDNVYFFGNKIIAVNKSTGNVIWRSGAQIPFDSFFSTKEIIYASNYEWIDIFDKRNGLLIARVKTPEQNTSGMVKKSNWHPLVTEETIIVFDNNVITLYKNPYIAGK